MKLLTKYIILYFEDEQNVVRRIIEDGKLRWEYVENDRKSWSKCDESYRLELRPSYLESKYKAFIRTQKLERILDECD